MAVRKKLVQDLVTDLLDKYHVTSGPVPVRRIAEDNDIEIKLDKVDDDLSGFLFRDKKSGRTIIGVNSAHHKNRQNFTIAHELGHYLLHEGEVIHLDEERGAYTINYRKAASAKGNDDNEREANLFAALLLMPEQLLRKELAGKSYDLLDENEYGLKDLAKKFGVSTMALTFRLSDLGLIANPGK